MEEDITRTTPTPTNPNVYRFAPNNGSPLVGSITTSLPTPNKAKERGRWIRGEHLSERKDEILVANGIEITDYLGAGHFGKVWRGRYRTKGKDKAISNQILLLFE